jgi:putative PIN family toxin of toxin-antitoxin system
MIRAVVDTNVVISGIFWGGVPSRVYDALVMQRFQVLVSPDTMDEFKDVVTRPQFAARLVFLGTSADELVTSYQMACVTVDPAPIPTDAVRDPKDVAILACATGGNADVIVTGDRDLLVLEQYAGIRILTPASFLDLLDTESR